MKILQRITEAFDSSMPPEIKELMKATRLSGRALHGVNVAEFVQKFDPSTAVFEDVTSAPISTLRKYIKSDEYVLFVIIDNRALMVIYDPNNKETGIDVNGTRGNSYKNYSLTRLVSEASKVYVTKVTTDKQDKRVARRDSRSDLVSRAGQPASTTYRTSFNGEDWKKDASGYWYDANRLARKLADLEVEDSAAVITKAADIFRNMVGAYTDHIKELANADDIFNIDSALRDFTYKGQNILSNASDKIRDIKYLAEIAVKTLDEINSQRDNKGSQRLSQKDYDDSIKSVKDNLKYDLLQLRSLNRQLNDEINK